MSTGSAINATKYLKRQGINKDMIYEAVVVNNNDSRKLDRVQARVEGVFDGIEDQNLPWAIANYGHPDGAYNSPEGDAIDRSGMSMVPKVGHKVSLRFPFDGDPHKPMWGSYTVDEDTSLPEHTEKNYPDRAVFKFSNGAYMIIDSRTNEIFLNNPGDVNLTVLGDVNQYIVGNQQLTVTDNKSEIAGYLLNAPETVLSRLNPTPTKKVAFKGLLSKGNAGNQHTTISGDQTTLIRGNRKTTIMGSDNTTVMRDSLLTVSGLSRTACARSETNG
jgi:hypothetical protein